MTAKLLETREIAPNVRHFVFQMPDEFAFVPGQFVSCTAEVNGSPITRAYSVASPPSGRKFDLCLNLVVEGHLSPRLFEMNPGDEIQMAGPYGGFIFRQPVEDSVLVATGTGIAPFRGMLQDQMSRDSQHQFTLLHGVRHECNLLYREEFEELARKHPNFSYRPILSRPEPDWQGRAGHVQAHLDEAIGGRRDLNVFICGLKLMVNEVRSILKAQGFDRKRIIYEKYD